LIKAECPVCGARCEVFEEEGEMRWRQVDAETHGVLEEGKVKCYWCGARLKFEDGRFLEEELGGMARSPHYEVIVRLCTLPWDPPRIRWPMSCVLCLKPVTSDDFHEVAGFGLVSGYGEGGYPEFGTRSVVSKVGVPYCSECRRKVKTALWWKREEEGVSVYPRPASIKRINDREVSVHRCAFWFRNPKYARMFREMNVKRPDDARKVQPSTGRPGGLF